MDILQRMARDIVNIRLHSDEDVHPAAFWDEGGIQDVAMWEFPHRKELADWLCSFAMSGDGADFQQVERAVDELVRFLAECWEPAIPESNWGSLPPATLMKESVAESSRDARRRRVGFTDEKRRQGNRTPAEGSRAVAQEAATRAHETRSDLV
ncbi:hypothetical protein, partial [Streptomyces sp. WAC08241]|uniref:hypothetical protein n=1 Tax=Streptomyces sp. WAC08241 TaxID=2487421 RepID=UPI000FC36A8E